MAEEKQILVFDSSEQDDFSLCKRRWHLIHHLQLRSITTTAHALDRGTLLHLILAKYYTLKMEGTSEADAIELAVQKGKEDSLEIEGLFPHECNEVYFQFREYCRYYSEIEDKYYPIAIEQTFFKIIYEDDNLIIALQGIIDYLGKYIGSDLKIVMDHKGVSKRENYTKLRNQFRNYALAAEADTVVVNKVGFQKTLPPEERFSRQIITYSQDELDEQVEMIIADGKEMLICMQAEYYKPNYTSCDKWGGCQFRENFCEARPDVRPYRIGTHFVVGKKWDVGKILENK